MSKPSVAIVQFARLASTRLPHKPLQLIQGETLIDRCLQYMETISQLRENVDCILIVPESDFPSLMPTRQYGIRVLKLTSEQAQARIWPDLIKPFLGPLLDYDWVWDANILCHPLLSIQTGLGIIDEMQIKDRKYPFVSVVEERNPLWLGSISEGALPVDQRQIQFHNQYSLADTVKNLPYYKPSHIAHCYPRPYLSDDEKTLSMNLRPWPHSPGREELIDIDTEDDLRLAQAIAPRTYNMPRLDAIAVGTGPSFFRWKDEWNNNPITYYSVPEPPADCPVASETNATGQTRVVRQQTMWSPSLYACGVAPNYVNNIRYYLYGDKTHVNNIPDPNSQFHPNVITYAGTRNLNDKRTDDPAKTPKLYPFSDLDLPHGESSGGMALSLACLHHNTVGIIGFDGYRDGFADDEIYNNFVLKFRELIDHWQNRGRRIVSLMDSSLFNPILEPAIQFGRVLGHTGKCT